VSHKKRAIARRRLVENPDIYFGAILFAVDLVIRFSISSSRSTMLSASSSDARRKSVKVRLQLTESSAINEKERVSEFVGTTAVVPNAKSSRGSGLSACRG
jgi:hypothetical protein